MDNIRHAKIKDVRNSIESVVGFMSESKFAPFDIEKSVRSWEQFISSGFGTIIILGDFDGALGGVAFPDPHRNSWLATEFFWYVKKEKRGAGHKLMKEFEAWAKEKGCNKVIMTHLADSMPEKLKSVYTRNGYKELETNFVKEV